MTRKIFIPKEYQVPIMEHMLGQKRCGVFAGMGMGKTTSALTAIDAEFMSGVETRPALVLAPLRVAQNTWPDEAAKWEHLNGIGVRPIVGNAAERKAALKDRHANVFTINYENIPWLVETLGNKWPFGRVIADESTKLKSFRLKQGGVRAQAIARVAHTRVNRWTNLTGTPSPNGLIDLWGQTWFLDAGERLGRSFTAFKDRWFTTGYDGVVKPSEFADDHIHERLQGLCLSLDPRDYFPLDEPIKHIVGVELPTSARIKYTQMEKELFTMIEHHEIEAFNAPARTQKLLQLASGAVYIDPDAEDDQAPRSKEWKEVHDVKMQALEEVIEEAAGMPVLVAYHFRSTRERLVKHFKKLRLFDKSPQTLRDWNAGKIPVMACHPASAGHGLNMQDGGNIICHIDHDWNLENFDQINERLGPMRQLQAGHDRNVHHYYIVARNTMDEVVMARRESKGTVQNLLLQALKQRKGTL